MGNYVGQLYETWLRSGSLRILLAIVWLLYPFAFVTLCHPDDVIRFQASLRGLSIPRYLTYRELAAALGETLVVTGILFLSHLVIVMLIGQRSQLSVYLWPVALMLVTATNGIWWLSTGYWDSIGTMASLFPVVATIGVDAVCKYLLK